MLVIRILIYNWAETSDWLLCNGFGHCLDSTMLFSHPAQEKTPMHGLNFLEKMSLSLWIAYYEKIQIDDSNPYSLSTSSQLIRYHVIFLTRTSTCHHRAHARSWWRISSRPCCAAACGAQFSTAAAAQGDLNGGNRQVLTQLTFHETDPPGAHESI